MASRIARSADRETHTLRAKRGNEASYVGLSALDPGQVVGINGRRLS
jgi:hypothetical protein